MAPQHPVGLSEEEARRRRRRSIAIATVLFGLVALFYALTIAKLGPQILVRPL